MASVLATERDRASFPIEVRSEVGVSAAPSQSTGAAVIVDVLKYADVMASTRPSLWLSVPRRSHERCIFLMPMLHIL